MLLVTCFFAPFQHTTVCATEKTPWQFEQSSGIKLKTFSQTLNVWYVYLHLPFMWVNIRSSHCGFGVQTSVFFSVQLDMRPCDFEFQDYFAHSRDAQGETNIFLRWMSSDRLEETQNKNVWICKTIWHGLMFDGIWCSIPIISRGNLESTGQWTQGTSISRKHWTPTMMWLALSTCYLPGRFFPGWEIGW